MNRQALGAWMGCGVVVLAGTRRRRAGRSSTTSTLSAMTATQVWEYRHEPPVFTPFVGSVQRFQNGNTLVGFGAAALMTEVTPAGQVLWEWRLTVNAQSVPYFYRARRVTSLYRYGRS